MKLDNSIISIEISNHGAELKSAVKDSFEYMWCADEKYWARTSPVLFPIVGSLKDKSYKLDGKVYQMNQHGFARDCEFEDVEGEGCEGAARKPSPTSRLPRRCICSWSKAFPR